MTTLWLIGRSGAGGFATVAAEIVRTLPGAAIHPFSTPGEALASAVVDPELIVVLQERPQEFATREIEALLGAQPLARFVVALGDWCASSLRSEANWPEAVTVPHWELPWRLRNAAIPLTAGRDEVAQSEATGVRLPVRSLPLLVDSPDRAFADLLCDLAAELGIPVIGPTDEGTRHTLLWDADPLDSMRRSMLISRRQSSSLCRVIALTAMPSRSVVCRLRSSGADAVLAKPFSIDALATALAIE